MGKSIYLKAVGFAIGDFGVFGVNGEDGGDLKECWRGLLCAVPVVRRDALNYWLQFFDILHANISIKLCHKSNVPLIMNEMLHFIPIRGRRLYR